MPGILQGIDVLQFLSGTILGSLNKGHPEDPEVVAKILEGYRMLKLDVLVAIGGDGSLDIIYTLAQKGGWNLIGIPKTIDNDVPFTERSVGFDTAIQTVTTALYDLTFTAASHDRVMVVEVMGRDAGHLALHAGIAGGADVILIPELVPALDPPIIDQICHEIAEMRHRGRKFALLVVAEGVKGRRRSKGQTDWRVIWPSWWRIAVVPSARPAMSITAKWIRWKPAPRCWATFSAVARPRLLTVYWRRPLDAKP
jgi:6-phosphofructokinase